MKDRRSAQVRRRLRQIVPRLFLIAIAACQLAGADPAAGGPGTVEAELNRTETVQDGCAGSATLCCRLSFVIHNKTEYAFASLYWDLVWFDRAGLIGGRMLAEAAPLPAGKTSVKLFDMPGTDCDRVGRLLLNAVPQCTIEGGDGDVDCLGLMLPASRASVAFFK